MEKQKIGNNLFPSYFRMTDKYISSPQTFYLQQIKYVHCRDTLQSVRDFKIKNNSRAESPMVYQPGAAPQVCNTPTKALFRSKGYILLFQSAKFFFILTYGATIGWKSISTSGKNLYFIRAWRTKCISFLQSFDLQQIKHIHCRDTLQSVSYPCC